MGNRKWITSGKGKELPTKTEELAAIKPPLELKAPDPTKQITAWSFSRWSQYEECPYKAKLKFVLKLPEPSGGPAIERGIAIHKLAEDYVRAPKAGKLPQELAYFANEFKEARRGQPLVEQELCFDSTWEPTGWFAKNAWCRIKTDLMFWRKDKLVMVDHKTGKRKESHMEQLSLYAIGAFQKFDSIDAVSAEVWYLDQGKPNATGVFLRDQVDDLKAEWERKTKAMLNDTLIAPKPGNYCRWCHFRKENGGPCKF